MLNLCNAKSRTVRVLKIRILLYNCIGYKAVLGSLVVVLGLSLRPGPVEDAVTEAGMYNLIPIFARAP